MSYHPTIEKERRQLEWTKYLDTKSWELTSSIKDRTAHLGSKERKRIDDAITFAAQIHGSARRADGTLYINHVYAVTEHVLLFQPKDPHLDDLVIAALLHDSIEEGRRELAQLARAKGHRSRHGDNTFIVKYLGKRYTPRAAAIIEAESRAPYPEEIKKDRDKLGEAYKQHIEKSLYHPDPGVFIVKLGDFLHNVTNIRGIKDTPKKEGWLRKRELARKWLNVFGIFLTRLWDDDILIPRELKEEIDTLLRDAWNDAINIDSETSMLADQRTGSSRL